MTTFLVWKLISLTVLCVYEWKEQHFPTQERRSAHCMTYLVQDKEKLELRTRKTLARFRFEVWCYTSDSMDALQIRFANWRGSMVIHKWREIYSKLISSYKSEILFQVCLRPEGCLSFRFYPSWAEFVWFNQIWCLCFFALCHFLD